MPKFSYFQQIINRTKIASDRPVSAFPILNPTRPLFRQWEVNQSFTLGDETSSGKERSLPPTVESTVPSVLEPPTSVSPALTHRPENPPTSHLAASPTLSPMPSGSELELSEAETLLDRADAIASPLTPKVPETITPLSSPSANLPPQPSLPKAVSTNSPTLTSDREIPTRITPAALPQSSNLPETEYKKVTAMLGKTKDGSLEITPSSPVMKGSSGISESLHGEQQGQPQQFAVPLSKDSDRPTIRPIPVPSPPLPDRLSQQVSVSDSPPDPESTSHPLKTTLEPPPVAKSSRRTEISDVPHRWVEPEKGSQNRQKDTVHIGSIEVHIMPPPVPPAQPTKPVIKSPPSQLSRGFSSSFGLRQG